jgi:hypothetical protein
MGVEHLSKLEKWALAVIGLHFLIVVFHGAAHRILPVDLSAIQLTFVVAVIIIGPLVSAFLIVRSVRAGALALVATMIASLIFGLYFHFVADSADNISHAAKMHPAAWSVAFTITACLLAMLEALGSLIGWLLYFGRRSSQ